MALASLVPFQGPKKSRFSGPGGHENFAKRNSAVFRVIFISYFRENFLKIFAKIRNENNIYLLLLFNLFSRKCSYFVIFRGIPFIWFKLSERKLVPEWGHESLAAPPPPLHPPAGADGGNARRYRGQHR